MYKKLIRWGSKFELHDLIMRLNKLWESGCTGKPGVLQPLGSHRVGHDWMTDWTEESGTYLCSPQKAKVKCVWWWQCYLIERKIVSNPCTNGGGQDDGGVGGSGVHLSPLMHQECLKRQQFSQKTRWILAGLPDYWEGTSRSTQNLVGQRKEGTRRKGKEGGEQVGPAWTWGRGSWSTGDRSPCPWPSTGTREAFKAVGEWTH